MVAALIVLITVLYSSYGANSQPWSSTQGTLVFSHVIFRHGDRAPSSSYPNDIHQEDAWSQGWKQLTTLGMRQMYEVGIFLRNRYRNILISPQYKRKEIYVRSSDTDRSIQSAQSVLAGLYPPQGDQVWNTQIPWQPIPVHTYIPEDEDLLLKPTSTSCPKYDKLFEDRIQSINREFENKYSDLFPYLLEKSGITPMNPKESGDIYSASFRERIHNMPQPAWLDQKWKNTNKTIYEILHEINTPYELAEFDFPEGAKIMGGYLLGDIVTRLQQKANGTLKSPTKMVVYSAHDGTVSAFIYNLGLSLTDSVPYGTTLLFELYRTSNGSHYVQLYIRNDTLNGAAHLLPIPYCNNEFSCPLEAFKTNPILSNRIYTEIKKWKKDCKIKKPKISKEKSSEEKSKEKSRENQLRNSNGPLLFPQPDQWGKSNKK